MFALLRKVRKSFISTGSTRKYLLYAIAEILLVVLGILLALQINNWNQARVDRNEELIVLENLKREFQINKTMLGGMIDISKGTISAGMALIKIMEEDKNIQEDFADSLIMVTLENWEFNPSQNVLSDLVQSGRFKLISNEKLRKLLFEWTSQMLNLDNEYGFIVGIVDDHYLPYIYKNYSMKDVDRYGKLSWSRGTNLAVNKERIFRDIQFENLLDDLLYRQTNYYESLIELDTIISSIMHETIVQYD